MSDESSIRTPIDLAAASDHGRILAAQSRSALLALLREADGPLSVVEAADLIGLQASTTRYHLDLLASAGLVDRMPERGARPGRPRIRYAPRPADAGSAPGDYEGLAGLLANQLSGTADPIAASKEAGRRWTEELGVPAGATAPTPEEAVNSVTDLMDRLGFAPDRPARMDRIDLRRCPFETVARRQRDVVCGVHAGMLEETFARLGGSVEVADLDPFVADRPLHCVVHLQQRGCAPGGPSHA